LVYAWTEAGEGKSINVSNKRIKGRIAVFPLNGKWTQVIRIQVLETQEIGTARPPEKKIGGPPPKEPPLSFVFFFYGGDKTGYWRTSLIELQ